MTWTIGTAVILIPIVFAGLRIWGTVKASAPEDSMIIQAMGAQFQWDFRYPGPDGEFGAIRPELYSLENYMGLGPDDPVSADDFIRTVGKQAFDSLAGKKLLDDQRQARFRIILNRTFEVPSIARFTLGR